MALGEFVLRAVLEPRAEVLRSPYPADHKQKRAEYPQAGDLIVSRCHLNLLARHSSRRTHVRTAPARAQDMVLEMFEGTIGWAASPFARVERDAWKDKHDRVLCKLFEVLVSEIKWTNHDKPVRFEQSKQSLRVCMCAQCTHTTRPARHASLAPAPAARRAFDSRLRLVSDETGGRERLKRSREMAVIFGTVVKRLCILLCVSWCHMLIDCSVSSSCYVQYGKRIHANAFLAFFIHGTVDRVHSIHSRCGVPVIQTTKGMAP